ncbi:MAG TPA: methionyl-tRNA formyltransferase [Oscillospiraceae bacterium]|nr:methionyl-tRNA formyltransferase [Oscillospiraceae bacterium]HPS35314.1 methionyl-tRNA formyltransferase [Oscillospiraceae bacterium]
MRILFMGTPEFAAASFEKLADEFEVAAAISQPDKPKGRGYELLPTPVKIAAQKRGIPVCQPASVRTPESAELIRGLRPDLIVVVAYGKILPVELLNIPPLGCINLHGSLLPKYRGAAPIEWAVINGEKTTGLTTMYMAAGMDDGDMIYKTETEIGENETAGQLRNRLAVIGADLLAKTLRDLQNGPLPGTPQNHAEATFAPLIKKELGKLDPTKPAPQVHNLVRGLSPSPGVFFTVGGQRIKLLKTAYIADMSGAPGTVTLKNGALYLFCGTGAVRLDELCPEGKKPMTGAAYYYGHRFEQVDK